jgi:hypothetical protein
VHNIVNVRSFNDQIYVLYSNVVHNLHTGVCKAHSTDVVDLYEDIVLNLYNNLEFGSHYVLRGDYSAILGSENGGLFVKEDYVINAYVVPTTISVRALEHNFSAPLWSLKDTSAKWMVDYDEHRLLLVCCSATVKLVYKSTGNVERLLNVHRLVNAAVVDDEHKMLLIHDDYTFSIWDASLFCTTLGEFPEYVCSICLHNHTLLFITLDRERVLAIE